MPIADREEALARYRAHAPAYDRSWSVVVVRPVRRRALARLDLRPGETVLDVACGTGINFAAIRRAIGPTGRLVGIDLSPDMLALAHGRVAAHGWDNVELIASAADDVELTGRADAALFSFSHDVLRTRPALERVLAGLRPGGRVVAAGMMDPWLPILRPVIRRASRPYVTTLDGFEKPWSRLAERATVMRVERPAGYLGSMYVVTATA